MEATRKARSWAPFLPLDSFYLFLLFVAPFFPHLLFFFCCRVHEDALRPPRTLALFFITPFLSSKPPARPLPLLFVSLCGNSSTNASISHAIHYLTLATWLWVPRRHLRDGFYFLRRQITAKYSVAFNSTAITHNLSAELLRPRSWPLTASGLQRRMLNDTLVSARALG